MKLLEKYQLEGAAMLCPMAGFTDYAFRTLCEEYGAAYTVSEMVSAKALTYRDRKTFSLMRFPKDHTHPVCVQLFGGEADIMAEGAKIVEALGADIIDINMGCPAPKIAGNGGGSALLRDLPLAQKIAGSVVSAVKIPVTVKMRIGYDDSSLCHTELARRMEGSGVSLLTVHARTRAQMYSGQSRLTAIAEVKSSVKIPVCGNGDIRTYSDAKRMLDETGCDMVGIGRGSLGNPFLFEQIKNCDDTPPDRKRLLDCCLRLAQMKVSDKGEGLAMLEFRKQAGMFLKGTSGASAIRNRLSIISTFDELREIILAAER